MAFITSPSVSVQNGSKTVEVSGNVDLSSVDEGWAVQIGTNKLVEASSGTAPNNSGISTLTLFEPWQNGNVTAATMEIIPNSGYQIALAKRIKSIVDRTIDVMQLQHDYASQLGQVTATDPDTNEQHVYNTLRQNQSEIDALLESFGGAAGYDVTESSTDTGNGSNGQPKLLKQGDGGLLTSTATVTLSDILANIRSVYYKNNAGAANAPSSDFGVGTFFPYSPSSGGLRGVNLHFDRTSPYFQVNDGGTLLGWKKILHTGNTGSIVTADYEEGVWTPSFISSNGDFSASINLTDAVRKYQLIGGMCHISLNIETVSISNIGTGTMRIGGLPFLSKLNGTILRSPCVSHEWVAATVSSPTHVSMGDGVDYLDIRKRSTDSFLSNELAVPTTDMSPVSYRNDISINISYPIE